MVLNPDLIEPCYAQSHKNQFPDISVSTSHQFPTHYNIQPDLNLGIESVNTKIINNKNGFNNNNLDNYITERHYQPFI